MIQEPKDDLVVIQAEAEGLPDVWIVNRALDDAAAKAALGWHLSIIIEMADAAPNGMALPEEQAVLGRLGEEIRGELQAGGNAALLASITWNGTRQLVYRVRDPEVANAYLVRLTGSDAPVRQMEYQMEEDARWEFADAYLEPARGA